MTPEMFIKNIQESYSKAGAHFFLFFLTELQKKMPLTKEPPLTWGPQTVEITADQKHPYMFNDELLNDTINAFNALGWEVKDMSPTSKNALGGKKLEFRYTIKKNV